MAVDIRCTVSCSLGTVISGSVSDEYVQGTGLVKCTGSVIIAAVITPAIGTAVTISYTKGGTTRTIPRKLRVLSSFADPFRATTSVELGCKLTYLQDKRDRINWTAFDDPDNTLTESDAEIITIPITAQSVADKCLYELDITSSLTLSNQFSIPRFDLSAGYVSVLSDLLVSECKCGYLDEDEELQVFSLNPSGGTGPAFDATQLVDISKIGVGQLPGEAVTVSYSTLKLKGEVQQTRPEKWDRQVRTATYEANINYTPPGGTTGVTRTYNILENDETLTTYTNLTKPDGEVLRLPSQRIRTLTSGAPAQVGNLYSEYLTKGIGVSYQNITKTTVETYEYDEEGNEARVEKVVTGGLGYLVGSMSVPVTFDDDTYVSVNFDSQVNLEREVRETITVGQVQQVTTSTYGSWFKSITGQQAIAAGRVSLTSAFAVSAYIDKVANAGLYLLDTRVETVATVKPVSAPTTAEVNNQAAAKGGNPNSGYRAESTSQLALAVGSATAQRRIEFSLPHAPDDRFYKVGSTYGSTASDAPQKAQLYGRVQNRLLLGNRNGMNIQLAPELMPTRPFAPFTITAKGVTAQYRANGTSWTFDASGMVVSTDALFWGGVGGTFASRWFPVAPGITSLPTTPAVVDGQMTVTNVVPVANETVLASGRLRLGIAVTGYSYPLELLTEVPAMRLKVGVTASRIRSVQAPAAAVGVSAVAPRVAIGATVQAPAAAIAIAGLTPAVRLQRMVSVPAATIAVAGVAPDLVGRQKTQVIIPVADIAVAGSAPTVSINDPSFSSVSLLLHCDGTNNSTTFTDSSNAVRTLTAAGNAKISTAQSKFGGASAAFDGTGDYLTASYSTSAFDWWATDFTIEAWVYAASWSGWSRANGSNPFSCLIGNMAPTGNTAYWAFGPCEDAKLRFFYWSGAENHVATSATLPTNQWVFISMKKNSSGVTLYINGTASGGTSAVTVTPQSSSSVALSIGSCDSKSINGYIDDLRITKVARSIAVPVAAFPNQ
jgi:hypothetical protein